MKDMGRGEASGEMHRGLWSGTSIRDIGTGRRQISRHHRQFLLNPDRRRPLGMTLHQDLYR